MFDFISPLRKVREGEPLVQCITNFVTVNDCANIILAAGGSPTMSEDIREVEESVCNVDALVCNMGAIDFTDSMILAGKKANSLGIPVVLDPVAAGGTSLRREMSERLLNEVHFTAIRGNASEILYLAGKSSIGSGVDVAADDVITEDNLSQTVEAAKSLAKKINSIIAVSGPIDIITDGNNQSMELPQKFLSGFWAEPDNLSSKFFIINDAIFSKLCILGDDVEPCFEGASITAPNISKTFSLNDDFKQTLYTMMKELQETLQGGKETVNIEEKQVETKSTVGQGDTPVIEAAAAVPETVVEAPAAVEEPAPVVEEPVATAEAEEPVADTPAETLDNPVEAVAAENESNIEATSEFEKKEVNIMHRLPFVFRCLPGEKEAGVEALKADVTPMREEYRARRDYVTARLNAMGLSFPEPKGAFYIFVDISRFGLSGEVFCERMIREAGVAAVPGSCFGAEGFIRLSYCCSRADLERGMDRIEKFISRL